MKKYIITLLFLFINQLLWAAAAKEESSQSRGKYLAEQGMIIPPGEILEYSYVSSVDYHYPDPENLFGVVLYPGHRQISVEGQKEFILVGIQGKRMVFEDLPPMNLAFVIDRSGSMSGGDKISWVKDSFDIFIDTVRNKDFVSLVVFDDTAEVVFSSTQMKDEYTRKKFRDVVRSITPEGGSNLTAGLQLGYREVMSNFNIEYVNRVLILSDGVGYSEGVYKMAENHRKIGVNISTIGLGQDFNDDLFRELSDRGGGSSRFISDREKMKETFGVGLSRMAVPAARDVNLELEFFNNIGIESTWASDYQIKGQTVRYFFPSVHIGDYETLLVDVDIPEQETEGAGRIARIKVTYTDLKGKTVEMSPAWLTVQFVSAENPLEEISNATVLKAVTILHFAQTIKQVGELYYECSEDNKNL